jgi:predicted nucleic acid-binding protein
VRVVFDTNVLVAAFATDGLCAKLVRRANKQDFTLLLCPVIVKGRAFGSPLARGVYPRASTAEVDPRAKPGAPAAVEELRAVLKKKLSATEEEIQNAVALILEVGILAEKFPDPAKTPRVVKDPNDDLILFCAVMNEADFLVTGDRDLLAIQKHGKTKIIAPRGFELLFD